MSEDALPPSATRVAAAAEALGLKPSIIEMPASTRTAGEAAVACGCAVGQIVKSLVFRGAETGRTYLLLVSGSNRVDEKRAAETIGEALKRSDADHVRAVTGYAIGGIPPFGHDTPLPTFMDRDLLVFAEIWAAAGTPRCVMKLDPQALRDATHARVITVY
jgi:prolyl-tRNA editing enzyme YbaK/EbsC (Cys-tRNA(Pro) deacylase)